MQRLLVSASLLTVLLSACGPSGVVPDPTQIQSSALTQVNGMLTPQKSEPTATPTLVQGAPARPIIPSAGTLVPGLPRPTTSAGQTPPAGRKCDQPLDSSSAFGPRARVLIKNNTAGPISFAMGVTAQTAIGLCGYLSWPHIPAGDTLSVAVPVIHRGLGESCYWVNAWINDPKRRSSVSDGGFCIDAPQHWVINVNYDRIRLVAR